MTYPDSYRRLKGAIDHADGVEDFDANILFEPHTRDLGDQISERVKSHVAVLPVTTSRPKELLGRHGPYVSLSRIIIELRLIPPVVLNIGHSSGMVEHLSDGDVAVSFVGQAEVGKVFYRPRHPSAAIAPIAWLQK